MRASVGAGLVPALCYGRRRPASGRTLLPQNSDRLDLDEHLRLRQRLNDEEGARRVTAVREDGRPRRRDRRAMGEVGGEDRDLDDVVKRAARVGEHGPEILPDLRYLRVDVALADELAIGVQRHLAGDVERAAGAHGVAVAGSLVDE